MRLDCNINSNISKQKQRKQKKSVKRPLIMLWIFAFQQPQATPCDQGKIESWNKFSAMISFKSCIWQLLQLLGCAVDWLLVPWIPDRAVWYRVLRPCSVLGEVSSCGGLWDRYWGQCSFSYLALSPDTIPQATASWHLPKVSFRFQSSESK